LQNLSIHYYFQKWFSQFKLLCFRCHTTIFTLIALKFHYQPHVIRYELHQYGLSLKNFSHYLRLQSTPVTIDHLIENLNSNWKFIDLRRPQSINHFYHSNHNSLVKHKLIHANLKTSWNHKLFTHHSIAILGVWNYYFTKNELNFLLLFIFEHVILTQSIFENIIGQSNYSLKIFAETWWTQSLGILEYCWFILKILSIVKLKFIPLTTDIHSIVITSLMPVTKAKIFHHHIKLY
jgi:hypothetical protein